MIARPSVVLPEPLSPTSATVVAAGMLNDTPATASSQGSRTPPIRAPSRPRAPEADPEALDLQHPSFRPAGGNGRDGYRRPASSPGTSGRQRSNAFGQRGANAQPGGGRIRSGTSPGMVASSRPATASLAGSQSSKAWV